MPREPDSGVLLDGVAKPGELSSLPQWLTGAVVLVEGAVSGIVQGPVACHVAAVEGAVVQEAEADRIDLAAVRVDDRKA
jgi:hypothetical protein